MWRQAGKKEGEGELKPDEIKQTLITVSEEGQEKQMTLSDALKKSKFIDVKLQAIRELSRLCQAAPRTPENAQAAAALAEWVGKNILWESKATPGKWMTIVSTISDPEQRAQILGTLFYETYQITQGYPEAQAAFFTRLSAQSTNPDTKDFWELLVGARKAFAAQGGPTADWKTNLDIVARRQELPPQAPPIDAPKTETPSELAAREAASTTSKPSPPVSEPRREAPRTETPSTARTEPPQTKVQTPTSIDPAAPPKTQTSTKAQTATPDASVPPTPVVKTPQTKTAPASADSENRTSTVPSRGSKKKKNPAQTSETPSTETPVSKPPVTDTPSSRTETPIQKADASLETPPAVRTDSAPPSTAPPVEVPVPKTDPALAPETAALQEAGDASAAGVGEVDTETLETTMKTAKGPNGYALRAEAAQTLADLSSRTSNAEKAAAWSRAILSAAIAESKKDGVVVPIKRVVQDADTGETTVMVNDSQDRVQLFVRLAYKATASSPAARTALLERLQQLDDRAQSGSDAGIVRSGTQMAAASALQEFSYHAALASGETATPPEGVRRSTPEESRRWLDARPGLLPLILDTLGSGGALRDYPTVRTPVEEALTSLSSNPAYAADAAPVLTRLDFYEEEDARQYTSRAAATLARVVLDNPSAPSTPEVARKLVALGMDTLPTAEREKVYAALRADPRLLLQTLISAAGLDSRLGPEALKAPKKLFSFAPDLGSYSAAREAYNASALQAVGLNLNDSDLEEVGESETLRRGRYILRQTGDQISVYPVSELSGVRRAEALRLAAELDTYARGRITGAKDTKELSQFTDTPDNALLVRQGFSKPYPVSELDYILHILSTIHDALAESPDAGRAESAEVQVGEACASYRRGLERLIKEARKRLGG